MPHNQVRQKRELSEGEQVKIIHVAQAVKRFRIALDTTDTDYIAERAGALCARVIKLAEMAGAQDVTAAVFRHLGAHDGRSEAQ